MTETTKTIIVVDELVKAESSNVNTLAYQASTKKAFVTFNNGGVYEYKDVEKEDYETLRDAESVGSYLGRVFKKDFEYEKLENIELTLPAVLTEELIEETVKKEVEDLGKA